MSLDFGISSVLSDIGEYFVISGVVSTSFNDYGDPTSIYRNVVCFGEVQVMDGSEDEVEEGILDRNDIIIFVDENDNGVGELTKESIITLSGAAVSLVSGTFRIVDVVRNPGHYEVLAKRLKK